MEYNVVRISPEHYKDLQFLFRHCFRRKVHSNFFKKKLDTKNFGVDHIGYLAYTKDGFLVASYILYPCRITRKNKTYLAAISGDCMTHSDHRRKGLFCLLGEKTFALAKESGIQFIYAFPNQDTFEVSKKIGLKYVDREKMHTYRIPVITFPLAKLCRKNKLLNSLYEKYVRFLFRINKSDIAQFNNSLLAQEIPAISHDADFFSYKSYSQNAIIKIENTNAWIKIDGELKIGDIEKKENINFKRLVKKLKRIAFFAGCVEIQTTVCEVSFIHEHLKNHFKSETFFPVGRTGFNLDFPIEEVKFNMGDFDTY